MYTSAEEVMCSPEVGMLVCQQDFTKTIELGEGTGRELGKNPSHFGADPDYLL